VSFGGWWCCTPSDGFGVAVAGAGEAGRCWCEGDAAGAMSFVLYAPRRSRVDWRQENRQIIESL